MMIWFVFRVMVLYSRCFFGLPNPPTHNYLNHEIENKTFFFPKKNSGFRLLYNRLFADMSVQG